MRTVDDENFDEAFDSALRACNPTVVPSDIKELFQDPKCEALTAQVYNPSVYGYSVRQ